MKEEKQNNLLVKQSCLLPLSSQNKKK